MVKCITLEEIRVVVPVYLYIFFDFTHGHDLFGRGHDRTAERKSFVE